MHRTLRLKLQQSYRIICVYDLLTRMVPSSGRRRCRWPDCRHCQRASGRFPVISRFRKCGRSCRCWSGRRHGRHLYRRPCRRYQRPRFRFRCRRLWQIIGGQEATAPPPLDHDGVAQPRESECRHRRQTLAVLLPVLLCCQCLCLCHCHCRQEEAHRQDCAAQGRAAADRCRRKADSGLGGRLRGAPGGERATQTRAACESGTQCWRVHV